MGSEHSSQTGAHAQRQGSFNKSGGVKQTNIRRQHTIANPGGTEIINSENGRPGSISPGPSVCSDIDLPYISYTVNRPIGGTILGEFKINIFIYNIYQITDSPKLTNKQLVKNKSNSRRTQQSKQTKNKNNSAHNIVVVRGATPNTAGTEKDPDVVRLQGIPMFLPIMRATLSLPAARDPEVLERLDPTPLRNLCLRYQRHLTTAANLVATEQNHLTQKIREVCVINNLHFLVFPITKNVV